MDLIDAELELAAAVGDALAVDPVGGSTHREVGGPVASDAAPVRAPSGVVAYDPADLTICVGAGTTVAELSSVLDGAAQECALDPRDPRASVGGTIATGLSGLRRLRLGPLRDQVLEVRFATADGRLVRGGGPTVKNVTGYDLPRLMVGSFGTLGVLTRLILRCRPRPALRWWGTSPDQPAKVAAGIFRASSVLWDGATTSVLLEGNRADVDAVVQSAGLREGQAPPLPDGPHRGRVAVPSATVEALARALDAIDGVRWLAEIGVGTVHVAADAEDGLARARDAAHAASGWLLREAGAPGLDGFGCELPNRALMTRVRDAFDPHGKLAPGRLPMSRPVLEREATG